LESGRDLPIKLVPKTSRANKKRRVLKKRREILPDKKISRQLSPSRDFFDLTAAKLVNT
jgi:hypothetical protein